LLNPQDPGLALEELFEIRKQGALEKVQKLEPVFKERIMPGLTLTEGLGLTETGIRVFEDSAWRGQQQLDRYYEDAWPPAFCALQTLIQTSRLQFHGKFLLLTRSLVCHFA
jgi:hypothetical protein